MLFCKIILLAISLLAYYHIYPLQPGIDVVIYLIILIISSIIQLLPSKQLRITVFILAITGTLFFPQAAFLAPVLLIHDRHYGFTLIAAGTAFYTTGNLLIIIPYLLTLYFIFLFSREKRMQKQYQQLQNVVDTLELNLSRQNEQLLGAANQAARNAKTEERNRIARDIHDHVGHLIARSLMMTGALIETSSTDNPQLPMMQTVHQSLNTALADIRKTVHNLHDDKPDYYQNLIAMFEAFDFCKINYDLCSDADKINESILETLLMVTKESLTNVMKHSNATLVTITLETFPQFIRYQIQDNGSGSYTNTLGLGLSSISERVENQRGYASFSQNNGFRTVITLPFK